MQVWAGCSRDEDKYYPHTLGTRSSSWTEGGHGWWPRSGVSGFPSLCYPDVDSVKCPMWSGQLLFKFSIAACLWNLSMLLLMLLDSQMIPSFLPVAWPSVIWKCFAHVSLARYQSCELGPALLSRQTEYCKGGFSKFSMWVQLSLAPGCSDEWLSALPAPLSLSH